MQFPSCRNESGQCKLIMCMESFLDTDHTTGRLWSSRKTSFCLQQGGIHTQWAEMSSSSNICCCYTHFTSAVKTRVGKWQGWKALSGNRTRLQLRTPGHLWNVASRLIKPDQPSFSHKLFFIFGNSISSTPPVPSPTNCWRTGGSGCEELVQESVQLHPSAVWFVPLFATGGACGCQT